MAILNEYVEIVELYKDKPTKIYLPNVKDIYVIDNTDLDGTDEVTAEYCKIDTKDGKSYIFESSLSLALCLYKDIMRFKMANLLDVRTNKIFVY
ncbi:MAG: hypothetical protein J1F07_07590 [Muribaculaceae bacterium]|nr:hypothetical protein [Muribaculaceae bacterium]